MSKSAWIVMLLVMGMFENSALSQKVLKDWFRLPERQEQAGAELCQAQPSLSLDLDTK